MRKHKRLRQERSNPAVAQWRFYRFVERTLIAANGEKTFVMSRRFWRLLNAGTHVRGIPNLQKVPCR
jgi:hypothetical protein